MTKLLLNYLINSPFYLNIFFVVVFFSFIKCLIFFFNGRHCFIIFLFEPIMSTYRSSLFSFSCYISYKKGKYQDLNLPYGFYYLHLSKQREALENPAYFRFLSRSHIKKENWRVLRPVWLANCLINIWTDHSGALNIVYCAFGQSYIGVRGGGQIRLFCLGLYYASDMPFLF